MFNVRSSENQTRIPVTVAVLLATLLMAFALGVTALLQVFREHLLLGEWLARPGPVPAAEVLALRQDIGTRIIVRSVASAVLLLCTLLTLWVQQRQLAIRRSLHQVKLFANNILASLNHGVITTDRQSVVTSINTAAVNLLGIKLDCVGRPIDCISSDELPLDRLSRCVTERNEHVSDRDLTLDRGGARAAAGGQRDRAEGRPRGDDRLRDPPPRRHRADADA